MDQVTIDLLLATANGWDAFVAEETKRGARRKGGAGRRGGSKGKRRRKR